MKHSKPAVLAVALVLAAASAYAKEGTSEEDVGCKLRERHVAYFPKDELERAEAACKREFEAAEAALKEPGLTGELAAPHWRKGLDALNTLAEIHSQRGDPAQEYEYRRRWLGAYASASKAYNDPLMIFDALGKYFYAAEAAERAGKVDDSRAIYAHAAKAAEYLRANAESGELTPEHPVFMRLEDAMRLEREWGYLQAAKSARAASDGRDADARGLAKEAESAFGRALAIVDTVWAKGLQLGPEPETDEDKALQRAEFLVLIAEERIAQGDRSRAREALGKARELISESVTLPDGRTVFVARYRDGAPAFTSERRCAKSQFEIMWDQFEESSRNPKPPKKETKPMYGPDGRLVGWESAFTEEDVKNMGKPLECPEYRIFHDTYRSSYWYHGLDVAILLNGVDAARRPDGWLAPETLETARKAISDATAGIRHDYGKGPGIWGIMTARLASFKAQTEKDFGWSTAAEAWSKVSSKKTGRDIVRAEEAARRAK